MNPVCFRSRATGRDRQETAKIGPSLTGSAGRDRPSSRYEKSKDHVVRAHLKQMYSIELPVSLEEHRPTDPEHFGLSIRLEVGLMGGDATDLFDLFVCTPSWIQEQFTQEGAVWGRHMLLISKYDSNLILQVVTRQMDACQGRDWNEVANKLARFAAWEFEDYKQSAA